MGKGVQLSGKEVAVAAGVVAFFAFGLTAVYFSMPASDYSFLKMPRSLEELQILRFDFFFFGSFFRFVCERMFFSRCCLFIMLDLDVVLFLCFYLFLKGFVFQVSNWCLSEKINKK